MPEIVIDQGVKCLNKDIFPHKKNCFRLSLSSQVSMQTFINLLTRIKGLEKHYNMVYILSFLMDTFRTIPFGAWHKPWKSAELTKFLS